MSLYPANASNPPKKPAAEAAAKAATSSFRKLIPIISGLLTFATVLSILIIFMDTSGKCSSRNYIHCGNENVITYEFLFKNYFARNSFAKIPFEYDTR